MSIPPRLKIAAQRSAILTLSGTLALLLAVPGASHATPPPVPPASGEAVPASSAAMPASGAVMPASGTAMPASGTAMPASGMAMPAGTETPPPNAFWSLYPTLNRTRLQQGAVVQAPQGEIIERIDVVGNVTYEKETITFFLNLRVGQPYDWVTARQDFRTLLNSNFFDDIKMRWEPSAEGIVLIIEVLERPVLRHIRIVGTEKADEAALLERMELLEMPIELDEPIDRQLMRRAEEVLVTMLQGDEGLQFVQVTQSTAAAADGASGIDAVYDVVEGDTVRIEYVYFEGATEFTQRELRWLAKKTSEHWLLSFLTKNDRFSPSGFEFDTFNIRNEYLRLGYLEVAFGEPEVEVHEVGRTFPLGDTRRLFVKIPIFEGPQYRLGEVRFEGNERFADEALLSLVPLVQGDLVDVKGVADAQEAMENIYSNFGFFQVTVNPVPEQDPDTGIADIVYVINENALYSVRRIEFEGNTNTRDYVMRRNLRIHENDLWSQGRVDASKFKIQQLGYFDNIEEEVTIVSGPGSAGSVDVAAADPFAPQPEGGDQLPQEPGEVDIKFKVSEVGRNQISFGGGVSALEGAFVQLGYSTRNLFGRGQTFSFSGQFGGRTTNARISFLQPYLFNRSIRFGFDLFRSNLDFIDFNQKSQGISARLGFPLDQGEFTTLFLEYNYNSIDIGELNTSFFGLSDPLFNALFLQSGLRTTSSFRPFLVYDSVDNPFNPSRGKRLTGSFEVAGGPLGGQLDFWKGRGNATWYIPTAVDGRGVGAQVKQVFAFNVDWRLVEPYGGLNSVPIFERFFLGGSTSVRGTQLRAIGPTDQFGNIIGGTRALQYNVEYIFQLADPVRIALFHDAGAAWEGQFKLPYEELRKTAGVEFRIFMPVFNVPFRFFWAYNFDPRSRFGEEKSSFEFAIGTTF